MAKGEPREASAPDPPPDSASVCAYGDGGVLDGVVEKVKVGQKVMMHVTGEVIELAKTQRKSTGKNADPYDNRTEIRLMPTGVKIVPESKRSTMADEMNAEYKKRTGYGSEDEDEG